LSTKSAGPKAPKILIFFNLHFDPGNRRISKSALLKKIDEKNDYFIFMAYRTKQNSFHCCSHPNNC
jgi:hypothetical protein